VFKNKTLVKLLLPLTALIISGCASQVVLYPIEKSDIFFVGKSSTLNNQTIAKDGWYVSQFYMDEVMRVKMSKK
jgi:hypothetical protein